MCEPAGLTAREIALVIKITDPKILVRDKPLLSLVNIRGLKGRPEVWVLKFIIPQITGGGGESRWSRKCSFTA